jgi:hypothetical protein
MLWPAIRAAVVVWALGLGCAPSFGNGGTDRTLSGCSGGVPSPPGRVMRCMVLRCQAFDPGAESTDHSQPEQQARSPDDA